MLLESIFSHSHYLKAKSKIQMNILIADSGSTKTNWILMHNAKVVSEYHSLGINPFVQNAIEIENILKEVYEASKMYKGALNIHFYGAGCTTLEKKKIIQSGLNKAGFNTVNINIEHDLLAAARSLFNDRQGIACILGTGSSSGVYNGKDISEQVMSLGYVLGDEGAGADMGKRLLVEMLKERMPDDLYSIFKTSYSISNQEIIDRIYKGERPNQFIASFTPFLSQNITHSFCRKIVEASLSRFISLNIEQYERSKDIELGFVGSVAFSFKDILIPMLEGYGYKIGSILKDPMPGLIEYHSTELS